MMTDRELLELLSIEDGSVLDALYKRAYEVKLAEIGRKVSLRGLIEMSNICRKNCYYCGIRRDNGLVPRYMLAAGEIIECALWAHKRQYGSIVIQSGEVVSEEFSAFIENVLREIKELTNDGLGVTLSLGEQPCDYLKRWREAGADRYLLRIETSNPELYRKLHPVDHSFSERVECLKAIKELGFQLGTGVMIGLPGQTLDDLVSDLRFMEKIGVDMIGMGPYIPHDDTPLGKDSALSGDFSARQLTLSLKMIACARILLKDVNIAATTALQALDEKGREKGLLAGANVLMPNITSTAYRKSYQLYKNKPCLEENSDQCRLCLSSRVKSIGEEILWGERGDSPHYKKNLN